MFDRIRQEAILESWVALIGSANGRSEEFFRRAAEVLASNKVPSIVLDYKEVAPSFEKGLFGKKRPAIIVTNKKLLEYKMFIMCRDYGNQLSISWYLVSGSPLLYTLSKIGTKQNPFDVFQLEELSCWVSTAHHTVIDVTKEIAESVNFDFSKVEQKSRGFLNVS